MFDIKRYEAMAKLDLAEHEREEMLQVAEKLVTSFDKIIDVHVGDALPLVSPLDVRNVMREDAVVKTVPREELLNNAPEQYDGYFQVPRTLE